MSASKWVRPLLIAGLVVTVVGAIDPLEGSLAILPGVVLITIAAWLFHSRHRGWLVLALALVASGVAALWGISAVGGFGGSTGRSNWWALIFVPYLAGWMLAVIGSVRVLREMRT